MRAYELDDIPGDQRLPHDSGVPVSYQQLADIKVFYQHIPTGDEAAIEALAIEREYKNRDICHISKDGLGDVFEAKVKMFFEEHMHEDEEIRYILDGSGFFDVRDLQTDKWFRIHVIPGDLIVLPAGSYHRFTLDESNFIRVLRLFKDEPKWTPYNRGDETDANPFRQEYINSIAVN